MPMGSLDRSFLKFTPRPAAPPPPPVPPPAPAGGGSTTWFGPGSGPRPAGLADNPYGTGQRVFDANTFVPDAALVMNYPQEQGESSGAWFQRLRNAAARLASQPYMGGVDTRSWVPAGSTVAGGGTAGVPGGGGGAFPGAASVGSGTAGAGGGPPPELLEERRLAFDRLRDPERVYDSMLGRETQARILAQMRGEAQPIDEETRARMFSRQADLVTAAQRSRNRAIRESMAARGIGGSGIELGAYLDSATEASGLRSRALNEVMIEQALKNFEATERARAESAAYLGQRASSIMPAALEEARIRSQAEYTGGQPGGYGAGSAPPAAVGQPIAPTVQPVPQSGPTSQYGGVTILSSPVDAFRAGAWADPNGGRSQPRQMGLGGAAGPWGAIERAHDQATDRNYDPGRAGRYRQAPAPPGPRANQRPSGFAGAFGGGYTGASSPAASAFGGNWGQRPLEFRGGRGQIGRGGGYY